MRDVQTPLLNPSTNRKKQKGPPVINCHAENLIRHNFVIAKNLEFSTLYLYILYIYIYLHIKTKHIYKNKIYNDANDGVQHRFSLKFSLAYIWIWGCHSVIPVTTPKSLGVPRGLATLGE
nr:MAG TPA: hypothetical protein [Caudoviricetes sp.]